MKYRLETCVKHTLSIPLCGLLLALFAAIAGVAHGASFDCQRAGTRVEHLICDSVDLDSLDAQLQGAYAGALDRSLRPEHVKAQQVAWLKSREACADPKCLITLYQRRIESLGAQSDEPPACQEQNTIGMNSCMAEYSRRAKSELDRYLAAARKRLGAEIKGDADAQATRDALAGLNASQTAWQAYQKAECDAVYKWWRGGTIRGVMYESCVQGLTKSRTQWIWSTWLSFEDSTPPLMPKPRPTEGPAT